MHDRPGRHHDTPCAAVLNSTPLQISCFPDGHMAATGRTQKPEPNPPNPRRSSIFSVPVWQRRWRHRQSLPPGRKDVRCWAGGWGPQVLPYQGVAKTIRRWPNRKHAGRVPAQLLVALHRPWVLVARYRVVLEVYPPRTSAKGTNLAYGAL